MENDLKSITDKITTDVTQLQQQDDKHYVPRYKFGICFRLFMSVPTTEVELRESLDAKLENQDVWFRVIFQNAGISGYEIGTDEVHDHDFKPWCFMMIYVSLSLEFYLSALSVHQI